MQRKTNLIRDKRAITPVLSNLLLTIVAVAAMAVATTATYVITTNLRENMSERCIAEDVWFSDSTTINVYLRNNGRVVIHITAVYIDHASVNFTRPFDLEIGENRWLNISSDWLSATVYYIDIVTTRGNHIAGYYKAP